MVFEQEVVDKMSRAKGPMGHRFINGQAAERDSEEEYDQDDNNPLGKFFFFILIRFLHAQSKNRRAIGQRES